MFLAVSMSNIRDFVEETKKIAQVLWPPPSQYFQSLYCDHFASAIRQLECPPWNLKVAILLWIVEEVVQLSLIAVFDPAVAWEIFVARRLTNWCVSIDSLYDIQSWLCGRRGRDRGLTMTLAQRVERMVSASGDPKFIQLWPQRDRPSACHLSNILVPRRLQSWIIRQHPHLRRFLELVAHEFRRDSHRLCKINIFPFPVSSHLKSYWNVP